MSAQITTPDTIAIAELAHWLSSDSLRGRGPYTAENTIAARRLADELRKLGARPLLGNDILIAISDTGSAGTQRPTAYNVLAVIPASDGTITGELIGITSHLDHLGVGVPDALGDSVYNGFLDASVPNAMVLDVARRYASAPTRTRALVVMFFNLEEQGLLGARDAIRHPEMVGVVSRMRLLVGVDAGSPAGEAIEWQLMGGAPEHAGTVIADSLARQRSWSTTSTPARAISDVFVFSEQGVPILFPIPGRVWKGYTDEQRSEAMLRFDHYHKPADQSRHDFPWVGTYFYADWLWDIVARMTGATAR